MHVNGNVRRDNGGYNLSTVSRFTNSFRNDSELFLTLKDGLDWLDILLVHFFSMYVGEAVQ